MARRYRVRLGEYDIGRWEYQEAEALVRRYRTMKRRADVLEKCNAKGVNGEEFAAMRWECAIVDQALRETAGGAWEEALRLNACDGTAYEDIDPVLMPTSRRNDFFAARREFFWRLWTIRQREVGRMIRRNIEDDNHHNQGA